MTVACFDSTPVCGDAGYLNLYEATVLETTQPCSTLPPPLPGTCGSTAYGYATSAGDVHKIFISLGMGRIGAG